MVRIAVIKYANFPRKRDHFRIRKICEFYFGNVPIFAKNEPLSSYACHLARLFGNVPILLRKTIFDRLHLLWNVRQSLILTAKACENSHHTALSRMRRSCHGVVMPGTGIIDDWHHRRVVLSIRGSIDV
jgi:hypothetical protein